MNVAVNRVLKGFLKNFPKDEKTIKYIQCQMKQSSFFSDNSEGLSGFYEALRQEGLETGDFSDSWPCPERDCFELNPDHSLLINVFFFPPSGKMKHKKRKDIY